MKYKGLFENRMLSCGAEVKSKHLPDTSHAHSGISRLRSGWHRR